MPSPIDRLAEEHQAIVDLNQILEQEQAHLIQADIDGLNSLVDEKNRIVARMTALTNARHQSLAAAGYAASDAGMQSWLDHKGDHSDHWKTLLSLAKSAKEINRTNGLLINKHMTRNQQALNVLQGTAPSSNFYGPNGQATSQASTRRLVVG
ncbi:flagella synthesis protein FlgN [Undibacterium arcticum]|uniref:flagella synthesis protein FlgN n=1 Tax=Undibacterium arcticum TaxID=1762892 RepID=UPI00361971EF